MANKRIIDYTAFAAVASFYVEIDTGTTTYKVASNSAYGIPQLDATRKIPSSLITFPSPPVTSVASKTGDVTLVVGDVSGAAALAGAAFTGAVSFAAAVTSTNNVTPTGGTWNLTGAASVSAPTLATNATGQGAANADWVRAQNYLAIASAMEQYVGDGSDGDLTINGSTTYAAFSSLSAGVYTLSRDVYANSITFSSGAKICTNGRRIFVKTHIDLTNAVANSIFSQFGTGNSASGQSGGSAGGQGNSSTFGFGGNGSNGANGVASGAGTAGTLATSMVGVGGGLARVAGAGGTGNGGLSTGGAGGGAPTPSSTVLFRQPHANAWVNSGGLTIMNGGQGASGGGSGGGGTAGTSGSGGGGGGSAAPIYVACGELRKGSGTAIPGIFAANGGNGGNAGTVSGTNAGGGGGGSGAGGSPVHIVCGVITGTAAHTITAHGGNGGAGALGTGTGTAGNGGAGGDSGYVLLFSVGAGTTILQPAVAGANAQTGGVTTGVTGGQCSLTI